MGYTRRNVYLRALALMSGLAAVLPARSGARDGIRRYPQTEAERAAGVQPSDYECLPGAFRRYGADPTGRSDSSKAINTALRCNVDVFDDYSSPACYRVQETLRFHAGGQILRGQGMGERRENAGTTIVYDGAPNGKILSVANDRINFSECTVRDLLLDGSDLANIGFEAYDDRVKGGSWRVRAQNIGIINVTHGPAATAIYLGTRDAPNFANDTIVEGCLISNCKRGLWGAGAMYQINTTTLVGCSETGIFGGTAGLDSSSAWTCSNSIFSSNQRDFDGFHIAQASFYGCWFENSSAGIYRAGNSHCVCFTGCVLHTFNAVCLMDFGNAAGYHFFGGNSLAPDTRSARIINVNAAAEGAVFGAPMRLTTSDGKELAAILSPAEIGNGGVRSTNATLENGRTLSLSLGPGCFAVTASVLRTGDKRFRTQSAYFAFLSDGDNECITQTAMQNGSLGGEPFTIACTNNAVTLRYAGSHVVRVVLSGTGAPQAN